MTRFTARRAFGWSACVALAAAPLAAVQDGASARTPKREIALLVVVSVDQMVPDQLERLAPWLSGGLGRFAHQGRVFTKAALQYGETETGPGHTSIGAGLQPTRHGVVGNDWIAVDQSRATYCYEDGDVRLVTSAGAIDGRGVSPRNLRAPGLADHLRAREPNSRCLAVSSKDRSAIGMSGRRADVALWWDKKRGGFATSTWYAESLPPWVLEWNAGWLERLAKGEFGQGWRAELPEDFERSRTAADEREGEYGRPGERAFPHRVPKLTGELSEKERALAAGWVYDGPAGDVCVAELALRGQRELALGERGVLDLLCVSLTSCDTVGHAYGPYSVEVTDVLLRADRLLGALFEQLDERVGAGRWAAALSADHGVMELPEALAERGLPARRLSGRTVRDALDAVRPAIATRFGQDFYLAHHTRGVRLSLSAMRAAGADPAAVREAYASALREAGADWLEHVVTFDELQGVARASKPPRTPLVALEAGSFDEERTCDVVLLAKRYHLVGVAAGTGHGTPHDYDSAIPLAYLGPGVVAGKSGEPAQSVDILPSLFALAGLEVPPGLDGRVLKLR